MKTDKIKTLSWLFGVNFYISAFTFGGGYVVIPMIRKYFVEKAQRFTEDELMEMAAIAQSSPGAIAINLSALAGYRTAGLVGASVSCLAAVCPPLVILSAISSCYALFRDNSAVAAVLKGMEAGVAALIVGVVADMAACVFRENNVLMTALVPVTFVLSFVLHINVALILTGSAALIISAGILLRKRGVGNE